MLQLRQQCGSPPCSPSSTPGRTWQTRPPLYQRRKWGNAHDISVDPCRRSLDHLITILPIRHDQTKSDSDLSLKNWALNAPPTPSPTCSPFDAPCSTPYPPPTHFFSRSLRSQYSDQFAGSRTTVHEKSLFQQNPGSPCFQKSLLQQNPEGYYRTMSQYMTAKSSSPSLSWSGYKALLDLKESKPTSPRTEAADEVKELHCSKLRNRHGFSVRRANFSRKSLSEYSFPTVQSTESEQEASSVTISEEVVQSDPEIESNCIRDAIANGSCHEKIVIQPKISFQGFKPFTAMQSINLPEIREVGSSSKSKETVESSVAGSGSTTSEWDESRSNVEAGSRIVTVGMCERGSRSSSMKRYERSSRSSSMKRYLHNSRKLMAMETRSKRDEIEAWKEAKTAKVLNRFRSRLKREESLIVAWESEQKAKADIHMTKVERKLEEKRAKELEKTQNKIARAHRKAEQRKAAERAKINAKIDQMTAIVDKIQSTGKLPWKCFF